jgi:CheY-like chemotaxis protein
MRRNILLIDDDADELGIFLDALDQLPDSSFTCCYARDARQAMDIVHHHVPGFIFLDFNIPQINGLELLAEMKRIPDLSDARIFIYSNHINEEVNRKAKTLGASGCIQKTHTIETLVAELNVIFAAGAQQAYTFFKGK